jgi:hypothetical protein
MISHEPSTATTNQRDVTLWRVNEVRPKTVRLLASGDNTIFDFADDGRTAIGGNDKGEILLLSTETGREQRRISVRGIKSISAARISPNGEMIIALGVDAKNKEEDEEKNGYARASPRRQSEVVVQRRSDISSIFNQRQNSCRGLPRWKS